MALPRSSRNFREDFDRSQEFTVARPFKYDGKAFLPGQTIDKTLFTIRRLRQLYDMRMVNQHVPTGAWADWSDAQLDRAVNGNVAWPPPEPLEPPKQATGGEVKRRVPKGGSLPRRRSLVV